MDRAIDDGHKAEQTMHVMLIDFCFFMYATQLANALSESCAVTLMLPDKAPTHYDDVVSERVKLRRFHMPRLRYPVNLLMVRAFFKTIAEVKPDVVHLLAWNPWLNLSLPRFPDVPLVATIHDAERHPGDRLIPLHGWQWRWADQIIVHAEVIKRYLHEERGIDQRKLHVIPLGQYDLFKTWNKGQVAQRDNVILFFGRIRAYKGLQYLIKAEPLITEQVPDVRIVIAGEGEAFDKYERLMVNKDRFTVHNYFIPDEMVAQLFQEASIVVLPYVEASQSGVIAVAYAFGKPVIATTVGGIPEVLEHGQTGFLVPPCDPESLARAVVTLLQDSDLREAMGRKAFEKAQSDLSWHSIASKTLKVYEQALATRAESGRSR